MAAAVLDEVPSSERAVPGSTNIPIAPWPTTGHVKEETVDANTISSKIIDSFNQALQKQDYKAIANLFVNDGYWRDHLGLTWDLRTAKGRDKIVKLLQEGHHLVSVEIDHSTPIKGPQVASFRYDNSVRGIQFVTTVTTKYGAGEGVVRLVPDAGEWKIWHFFTSITKLKGHEEAVGHKRARGVQHGAQADRKNVSYYTS